jgi:hypothetical protein
VVEDIPGREVAAVGPREVGKYYPAEFLVHVKTQSGGGTSKHCALRERQQPAH